MERNIYKIGKKLFITSDEEIKDGDYALYLFGNLIQKVKIGINVSNKEAHKKIILTTDQDLIKDGVQEIPDDFLEWFVKNPSCEFVNIVTHYPTIDDEGDGSLSQQYYTLTIPKEEPKQSIKDKILSETPESVIQKVRETTNELVEPKQRLEKYSERFDNKENEIVQGVFNPENWGRRLVEDKQETFEEAAEKSAIEQMEAGNSAYILGFIEGVKWHAEQFKKK
jgi:hypothetical protein